MRISTKIVFDMETGIELLRDFYDYLGPVDLFCGASGEQKAAYAQQMDTARTLNNDFNIEFKGNQAILANIVSPLEDIVAAGVGQFGLTPEETAALRTGAKDQLAAAGREATGSTREALAAIGGGNMELPSGSKAAIEAGLTEDQAYKQSQAQLDITKYGYEEGRKNFFTAEQELASAPGQLENPTTALAGEVTGAEGLAGRTANEIAAANNAWIAPVAGAIGGVLSGPLGGKIGGSLTPKASTANV